MPPLLQMLAWSCCKLVLDADLCDFDGPNRSRLPTRQLDLLQMLQGASVPQNAVHSTQITEGGVEIIKLILTKVVGPIRLHAEG